MMNKYENALYLINCRPFYDISLEEKKSLIIKPLKELVDRAMPPTEQEICEALSGHCKNKVFYDNISKRFYDKYGSITNLTNKGYLHIIIYLSPNLITLISRFYEKILNV